MVGEYCETRGEKTCAAEKQGDDQEEEGGIEPFEIEAKIFKQENVRRRVGKIVRVKNGPHANRRSIIKNL